MDPVAKALWFIESRLAGSVSLDEIAAAAGVSRFHMTRAFGLATGSPALRYARGRRLTEAARLLAAGAPDILTVALDAGYGSHEAFTRAFHDLFGATPEALRARGTVDGLELVEPLEMNEKLLTTLAPPRFETAGPMLLAGLGQRYNRETSARIPMQWRDFAPHIGNVPGQIGRAAYGVLHNGDDDGNVDYLCGVEVRDFSGLPPEFARLRLSARRYAVFTHALHVSEIRRTWHTIWNQWLPDSGYESADAPDFERYGDAFDPVKGVGGMEIWLPVKARGAL